MTMTSYTLFSSDCTPNPGPGASEFCPTGGAKSPFAQACCWSALNLRVITLVHQRGQIDALEHFFAGDPRVPNRKYDSPQERDPAGSDAKNANEQQVHNGTGHYKPLSTTPRVTKVAAQHAAKTVLLQTWNTTRLFLWIRASARRQGAQMPASTVRVDPSSLCGPA